MKFFSGLMGSTEPAFNTQKAVMTIVVAAIKVDGHISDEENRHLRTMCSGSPIFASNTKQEDDAVISFADNITSQLKEEAIAKAASALKPELRETAFAFACEMILADGMVGASEDAFLSELAQRLGVSEATGKAVVQATLIRMRGAA